MGRGWPEALGLVLGGPGLTVPSVDFESDTTLRVGKRKLMPPLHSVQPLAPGLGFIGLGKRAALV